MADIVLKGNTSGSITITSPDVSGVNVLTLPVETGTILTTNTPLPEVSSVEFAGAGTSSGNITITAPDTDETNTLTFPETTGTFATENSLGMRNLIINGNMAIDQRNAGSVFTITADDQYGLDRWVGRTYGGAGRFSMQQVTDAPEGFLKSTKITVTTTANSGAGGYAIEQRIEGNNLTNLKYGSSEAKIITKSFWIKASIAGTYTASLRTSDPSGNISSCVNTFTISVANTWEYKTVTYPANTAFTMKTDNGVALFFDINFGAQTSKSTNTLGSWQSGNFVFNSAQVDLLQTSGATINITGVQLETGTVATPFENLQYGQQLSLCQRYYEVVITNDSNGFYGTPGSGAVGYSNYFYQTTKRAAPTVVLGAGGTLPTLQVSGQSGFSSYAPAGLYPRINGGTTITSEL